VTDQQRSSGGPKIGGIAFAVALACGGGSTAAYFEGYSLTGYADPAGIPTICRGHTGPEVRVGQIATDEQCAAHFTDDMRREAAGLERCVRGRLKPNEAAAILSWTFNVGHGAACASTLIRMVNAGRPGTEFCPQLDRWKYTTIPGVKVELGGLAKRRAAERALCEGRQ
jgi:lysozyme